MADRERLKAAKRRVRELETELNGYVSRHREMELPQFEKDKHYKLLLKQLENAEAVVRTLERK
jgi:hypothetical protein